MYVYVYHCISSRYELQANSFMCQKMKYNLIRYLISYLYQEDPIFVWLLPQHNKKIFSLEQLY